MADAFENILGQPKVREFLRASVVSERVTQAYLFVGPAGSNKTQAAYALAQALMCPKGPRGPRGGSCGACDRCGRILRRKHPDVRYFAPAGANGYLVEQVREIVADTALSPIQADKKIYILDRVDQLGASAANAFLKTLEEPADDVVMILLGRTRESVLPTIVSRCQVVPFRHIPASEAAGIVAQNTGADPAQARQAIEACGGTAQGQSIMAKLNTKMGIGMKTLTDRSTRNLAEMLSEGSSQGVMDCIKSQKDYPDAAPGSKRLMQKLQDLEEENRLKLEQFL